MPKSKKIKSKKSGYSKAEKNRLKLMKTRIGKIKAIEDFLKSIETKDNK